MIGWRRKSLACGACGGRHRWVPENATLVLRDRLPYEGDGTPLMLLIPCARTRGAASWFRPEQGPVLARILQSGVLLDPDVRSYLTKANR